MAKLIENLAIPKEDVENVKNISDLVEQAVMYWPDKVAMTSLGGKVSYKKMNQDSKAVASWLESNDFKKGDRIAVALPNVLANPIAILGIVRAGLIAVCLNPLYTSDELGYALQDSGAKCLFAFEPFFDVAQKAISGTAIEHMVIVTPGEYLGIRSSLVNVAARLKFGKKESIFNAVKWNKVISKKAQPLQADSRTSITAGYRH